MKWRPIKDKCLVRKDEAEETFTPGGLIVRPETSQERPISGVVLEIGPGETSVEGKRMPMEVKVGDKVFFPKYSGVDASELGKNLFIIPEKEIFLVVETMK